MSGEYSDLVKHTILDGQTFVKAVFSGPPRGKALPWAKVTIRPVLIKNERYLQFSYAEPKKDITKNYTGPEVIEKLDELLALPFKSINLQTTHKNISIQITKKGKGIIHQHQTQRSLPTLDLAHDRPKELLLPANQPDPFLQRIGIMTQEGKVKAEMQGKFRQINEFLKLLVETRALEKFERLPLKIVDCGCGNAYLTFAVYYYLNQVLGLPAEVIGLDVNQSLLQNRAEQVQALGWSNLTFVTTRIVDFQPETPPDIVLALHACDTATDEALAQSIKWQSKMILSVPCCHRHLQRQLEQQPTPSPFQPMLRHNVFKERFGDILTDTFRALILRILGYKTDIVEFVSTEHTGKNLMIRAIKSEKLQHQHLVEEYQQLKEFWQVTPYLEQLLEEELSWMKGLP